MFRKKQDNDTDDTLAEIRAKHEQKRDTSPQATGQTFEDVFGIPEAPSPWVYPDEYKATEPRHERQVCCHLYGVSVGGDALGANTLTAVSLPLASLCAILEAPLGKVECSLTVQTHTHSLKIEGKRLEGLHYQLSEHQIGVVRKYQPERCIKAPDSNAPIITNITLES